MLIQYTGELHRIDQSLPNADTAIWVEGWFSQFSKQVPISSFVQVQDRIEGSKILSPGPYGPKTDTCRFVKLEPDILEVFYTARGTAVGAQTMADAVMLENGMTGYSTLCCGELNSLGTSHLEHIAGSDAWQRLKHKLVIFYKATATPTRQVNSSQERAEQPNEPILDFPRLAVPIQHERLRSLTRLGQNWDGYNSKPISQQALRAADDVLQKGSQYKIGNPRVAPVTGGGVELEWTMGKVDLEVEVLPDGSLEFVRTLKDGRMEDNNDLPADDVRSLFLWLAGEVDDE